MSQQALTRRDFLKTSAAALGSLAAGSVLAACGGALPTPFTETGQTTAKTGAASAGPKKLKVLQAAGFVEAADKLTTQKMQEWGKANGWEVEVEIVVNPSLPAKVAAVMSVQAGPDIIMLHDGDTWINAHSLVDLTPIVDKAKKAHGEVFAAPNAYCFVNGKYLSMPYIFAPNIWIYRSDWFSEVGYNEFPKTFDELLDAGAKLKAKGHGIGQSLASNNGDARAFAYSILWGFGGAEVDQTGKVIINSPESLNALTWSKEFFAKAVEPAGLAWDAGGNNRAWSANTISATINAPSIYVNAKAQNPEAAKNINIALSPKGAGGGWNTAGTRQYSITRWSPNQEAAMALILHMTEPDAYNAFVASSGGQNFPSFKGYADHPTFKNDPKLGMAARVATEGRWPGYAGSPNAASSQVWIQDVITNMFSRVVSGQAPDAVLADTDRLLKQMYS